MRRLGCKTCREFQSIAFFRLFIDFFYVSGRELNSFGFSTLSPYKYYLIFLLCEYVFIVFNALVLQESWLDAIPYLVFINNSQDRIPHKDAFPFYMFFNERIMARYQACALMSKIKVTTCFIDFFFCA